MMVVFGGFWVYVRLLGEASLCMIMSYHEKCCVCVFVGAVLHDDSLRYVEVLDCLCSCL